MKLIIGVICSIFLSGCITTSVKDYTDSEYTGFQARKILIATPHGFDESLRNKLQKVNVNFAFKDEVLVPTRTYSEQEIVQVMNKQGFDSALSIKILGHQSANKIVGYNTNTNGSYGYGSWSSNRTTTPITSSARNTKIKATLYDSKNTSGPAVWVGLFQTEARGHLFTSGSQTVNEVNDSIIKALVQKGHFQLKVSN